MGTWTLWGKGPGLARHLACLSTEPASGPRNCDPMAGSERDVAEPNGDPLLGPSQSSRLPHPRHGRNREVDASSLDSNTPMV